MVPLFIMEKKRIIYIKYKSAICVSAILFCLFLFLSIVLLLITDKSYPKEFSFWDILLSLSFLCAMIFIHELIHALGFLLCGVSKKSIKFGVNINKAIFYCHTDDKMPLNHYRFSLILPIIITGIIPFLLALFILNFIYSLVVCLSISTCSADLLLFIKSFKIKGSEIIVDHPFAPAFYVINQEIDDEEAKAIEKEIISDYLNLKNKKK